jgi:hypothetical protein
MGIGQLSSFGKLRTVGSCQVKKELIILEPGRDFLRA